MEILVTAPHIFDGDDLEVGKHYVVSPLEKGTLDQNKAFHALLQEYWRSGCCSYAARSFTHFRALIKLYLGAGAEKFYNVFHEDGTPCPTGRLEFRLKSWHDYTKKERSETIDNLIAEMHQVGVCSKKFYEILSGMEEEGDKKRGK